MQTTKTIERMGKPTETEFAIVDYLKSLGFECTHVVSTPRHCIIADHRKCDCKITVYFTIDNIGVYHKDKWSEIDYFDPQLDIKLEYEIDKCRRSVTPY